jgi:galactonate dehydratase
MVDAHFGVTAPHSAQGPVCSAACSHLNASTPNFYIHEIFDDYNEPWEKDIVIGGVEVKDGHIEPSNRPGLGLELNWKEIKKHPHQQGYWLPLFKSGWETRKGEK